MSSNNCTNNISNISNYDQVDGEKQTVYIVRSFDEPKLPKRKNKYAQLESETIEPNAKKIIPVGGPVMRDSSFHEIESNRITGFSPFSFKRDQEEPSCLSLDLEEYSAGKSQILYSGFLDPGCLDKMETDPYKDHWANFSFNSPKPVFFDSDIHDLSSSSFMPIGSSTPKKSPTETDRILRNQRFEPHCKLNESRNKYLSVKRPREVIDSSTVEEITLVKNSQITTSSGKSVKLIKKNSLILSTPPIKKVIVPKFNSSKTNKPTKQLAQLLKTSDDKSQTKRIKYNTQSSNKPSNLLVDVVKTKNITKESIIKKPVIHKDLETNPKRKIVNKKTEVLNQTKPNVRITHPQDETKIFPSKASKKFLKGTSKMKEISKPYQPQKKFYCALSQRKLQQNTKKNLSQGPVIHTDLLKSRKVFFHSPTISSTNKKAK